MTWPTDEDCARAVVAWVNVPLGRPPSDKARAALIAGAPKAEPVWRPIESAPVGVEVLLYCPDLGGANKARIELGIADNGRGSHHSWATHWMPLPAPPTEAKSKQGND